jgi:hypothetical protein
MCPKHPIFILKTLAIVLSFSYYQNKSHVLLKGKSKHCITIASLKQSFIKHFSNFFCVIFEFWNIFPIDKKLFSEHLFVTWNQNWKQNFSLFSIRVMNNLCLIETKSKF